MLIFFPLTSHKHLEAPGEYMTKNYTEIDGEPRFSTHD